MTFFLPGPPVFRLHSGGSFGRSSLACPLLPSNILAPMKSNALPSLNRRQFLRQAGAAFAVPLIVHGPVLGLDGAVTANNRIAFGAIGVGNRAQAILPNFLALKEIQWVAVSDCRDDRLRGARKTVDDRNQNQDCRTYPDFRDLLAEKDIDAVLIASGNRWHGLGSIYASRAGKDIYCEKPITLTLAEGRKLVETTNRFGTIY